MDYCCAGPHVLVLQCSASCFVLCIMYIRFQTLFIGFSIDECLYSFLHDMGRVLEFREWVLAKHGSCTPSALGEMVINWQYSIEEMITIIQTARRLVAFACGRAWIAVTEAILPVAALGLESVAEITTLVKKEAADVLRLIYLAVKAKKGWLVSWHVCDGSSWQES